ncbi:MAG: EVE domain-containing protein [Nitratireductor sp.]|nr:EVE domain-containing protein [Nitratireductor sp.]
MTKYWIGVASRDHVKAGEDGGFCQLGHGKHAPVKRLAPGDGIVYYAPRERLGEGDPVQAFVTIGRIRAGEAYRATQNECFHPWRRDVDYLEASEAPIRPLLNELSFIGDQSHWGYVFRRGAFAIPPADFRKIAHAMQADWREAD